MHYIQNALKLPSLSYQSCHSIQTTLSCHHRYTGNKEYSVQTKQGKTIAFCWIPSHGIPGNEKANSAAKDCLSLTVTALKSPASELLPRATKLISEKWQKSWNNCTSNKLQSINHTIGVYQHVRSLIYLNNLSHSLIH